MSLRQPRSSTPDADLFELALYVYRYARRWAVGQSRSPEDAAIYDVCIALFNEEFAPRTLGSSQTPSAVNDRYMRFGAEPVTKTYSVPVTVQDALVTLHRFARRYTNGRGSYTAALVNDTARQLLAHGISLDETREADGTVWAADGVGGEHDGLTDAERAEALASLPHHPRNA